jgi:phosphoadenosine phosphosulfate reductase
MISMEITESKVEKWNETLKGSTAEEIIHWAMLNLDGLYQTTSFGLTGLVILHIINITETMLPIIFIDTLHHFKQTYGLIENVKQKYNLTIHIAKPLLTLDELESTYGQKVNTHNNPSFTKPAQTNMIT